MTVYVSDLFTATPAPVNASPTSTRTWQWLRGSSAISGATSDTYTAVTADIGSTLSATQLETNFLATTTATSAATEVVQAFDPIRLFSASEPGVWYDPSDMSTLYQNATGTIPVTSFGQPIGLMLDKSRGLVLGPEAIVNGDFSTDTVWNKGSGWTISGGVASCDGSVQFSQLSQANVTPLAKSFKVSFTLVSKGASVTSVRVVLGGAFVGELAISSAGTYSGHFFNSGASLTFALQTSGGTGAAFAISIDNISVKELPGLHATQSTEASRPLYGIVPVSGRRNLLTWSEDFRNTAAAGETRPWVYNSTTVTANVIAAPDGTVAADKLVEAATTATHGIRPPASEKTTQTWSLYAKEAERRYLIVTLGEANTALLGGGIFVDLRDGTVLSAVGNKLVSYAVTPAGNGWYRYSVTVNSTGAATEPFPFAFLSDNSTHTISSSYGAKSYTGDGTSGAYIWGAQLELGSTPTAYQRVSTDLDVTEAGVASVGYLRFDGSTSWMVTPTITPGTDKVQVFAGVRKLSDVIATIAEMSVSADANNGIFALANLNPSKYFWRSKGTTASDAFPASAAYATPITNILTGLGDISGDLATLRINGTQVVQNTADQGTGNYLAYPLYLGRRGGTTLPFNGHLFPLIVRFGPNLTAARIAATEAWVATKTGGVTL